MPADSSAGIEQAERCVAISHIDEGEILMDKKIKICEQAKSYAEKKGIKDIDFNSIRELIPSERFSIWTAAEDIADGDLAFTFDVKEIPETWIWAKCECPGYYK